MADLFETINSEEAQNNTKADERDEKAVQSVMKITGQSYEDAVAQMEDAKERLGIQFTEYYKYGFYDIEIKDQDAKYKMIIEKNSQVVVVVSASSFNALGVVRSLGAAGYTVELVSSVIREGRSALVASSKYVSHSVETLSLKMKEDNNEQLMDELLKYAGKYEKKPVLVPVDDYTTSIIDLNRDKLEDIFIMPCIVNDTENSTRHYMDKSVQSKIAQKHGLPTPKEWVISIRDEDIIIPDDIVYPCYCKPLESSRGAKNEQLKCDDEDKLIDHLRRLRENYEDRSILVQEFLNIDTEIDMNGVCIDQEIIIPMIIGKEVVGQAQKGVTLVGKTYPVEKLGEEICNKIINMLKEYHYIGMFDMELNIVGGKIYFNELNLRSGAPNYVYTKSGVNLPDLFVKGILGQKYTNEEIVVAEYGKTFLCENVAWKDCLHDFLTKDKIETYMETVDITIVHNSDDPKPGKLFLKDIDNRIRKQQQKEKREDYITIVTEATGWGREFAAEQMKRSREVTGASYEQYVLYKFWQLSEQVQKTYFIKGDSDRLDQRYNTSSKTRKSFVNKDLFCAQFEEYLGRPWLSTKELTAEEFKNKFGNSGKIVYKPLSSGSGQGSRVFKFDEASFDDIFEEISALPAGLLEGYVVQHPEMQKLASDSINTIRIVTVNTGKKLQGVEKNKVNFVYAGISIGYGNSFDDNLHSERMMAVVDLLTGAIETHGYNRTLEEFVKHPDTEVTIKGFKIPFFNEIKRLVKEAGEGIHGYLGWDIAVTENGPVLIEVKTHPAPDMLQIPYATERKGMRYIVEKYLAEPAKKKAETVKSEKKQAATVTTERKDYLSTVIEATGWEREYAKGKMDRAHEETGITNKQYAAYRFWELSEEDQKTYFLKKDAELLSERFNKDPQIRKTIMNKEIFCANFEKYLGRPWLSTKGITINEFNKKFVNSSKIIFKPQSTSGGNGIRVFDFNENPIDDIFQTICALPVGILEGYVDQHPEMKKLSLNSVNTVRVVTIHTNENLPGVKRNKVNFVYAGIRMGYGDGFTDTLDSGGIMAGVNLETGVIETHGYNRENEEFVEHPNTGVTIKGFQIPYFNEIKQLIEEAGGNLPGYYGWDIAITENGPIIIEANTRSGSDMLQTPYVQNRMGMRYVVEKYLAEPEK